jgi:anti-sigma B factor antagonist
MVITLTKEGEKLNVKVEGRLDTTTSPDLEEALKNSYQGINKLVFDFAKLDYISSAGLRILLGAQKKMNAQGKMSIVNANDIVKSIFEVTGFSTILTIE